MIKNLINYQLQIYDDQMALLILLITTQIFNLIII
jgi:hypothetical protein